jgi:hypothetical protein
MHQVKSLLLGVEGMSRRGFDEFAVNDQVDNSVVPLLQRVSDFVLAHFLSKFIIDSIVLES